MTLRVRVRPPLAVFLSLILLFLIFLALAPAMADEPSNQPRTEDLAIRMTQALALNTAQQNAVRDVMREFGQSMRQVMDKHGIDPAEGRRPPWHKLRAARADLREARTQLESQMAEILTPQQMSQFRTFQKQQRRTWMTGHQRP